MNREHWLAGLAGFAAVGSMLLASPEASAAPACERRSASHLAEHGGRLADDAYHVSHGELPSCEESNQRHDDNGNKDRDFSWPGGRDKLGPFR